MGAQILIREYLDGAPFLAQLTADRPGAPRAGASGPRTRSRAAAARGGLDPVLAVVTVGGLAALVASSHEAARPFVREPLPPEAWRRHVFDLLVNGLASAPQPPGPGAPVRQATCRAPARASDGERVGVGSALPRRGREGVVFRAMRTDVVVVGAGHPGLFGRASARAGGPPGGRARALDPGRGGLERSGRDPLARRGGARARPVLRALPRLARALPRLRARGRGGLGDVGRLPARSARSRSRSTTSTRASSPARAEKLRPRRAAGRGARRRRGPRARAGPLAGRRAARCSSPTRRRSTRARSRARSTSPPPAPGRRSSRARCAGSRTEGGRAAGRGPRGRPDRRRRGGARRGELEPARRGARAPRRRGAPGARPDRGASTRARRSSRAWSSPGTATWCRGPTAGSCAARRWRTSGSRRRSPPAACATCSTSRSRSRRRSRRRPSSRPGRTSGPASPDGEPILGDGDVPGLFYATGHTRNGILLAPITADAIAAAVLGRAAPVDLAPFSPRGSARLDRRGEGRRAP